MSGGTDPDPVPNVRVRRAREGTRHFTFQIPNLFLALPKTKRGRGKVIAPLLGHKLFFVVVFRLVFQPREGILREMFCLSVNFKIKQNCLMRRVYSDRKPGCLSLPVCSFPNASTLALGTTSRGAAPFQRHPSGPGRRALCSELPAGLGRKSE